MPNSDKVTVKEHHSLLLGAYSPETVSFCLSGLGLRILPRAYTLMTLSACLAERSEALQGLPSSVSKEVAREMIQWLTVLSAHPEDLRLVPSTHIRQITAHCSSSESNTFFWPPPPPAHMWHTLTQTHKQIQIFKAIKIVNFTKLCFIKFTFILKTLQIRITIPWHHDCIFVVVLARVSKEMTSFCNIKTVNVL